MKSVIVKAGTKAGVLMLGLLIGLVTSPVLSSSHVLATANTQPMMSITVTNNSSREIRHLYLSPVDRNAWGPDLLDGTVMTNGQSFTITDAACSGNEIKVIAEDQQGCFLYGVVSCAEASTSWTITNDTPADCG